MKETSLEICNKSECPAMKIQVMKILQIIVCMISIDPLMEAGRTEAIHR